MRKRDEGREKKIQGRQRAIKKKPGVRKSSMGGKGGHEQDSGMYKTVCVCEREQA